MYTFCTYGHVVSSGKKRLFTGCCNAVCIQYLTHKWTLDSNSDLVGLGEVLVVFCCRWLIDVSWQGSCFTAATSVDNLESVLFSWLCWAAEASSRRKGSDMEWRLLSSLLLLLAPELLLNRLTTESWTRRLVEVRWWLLLWLTLPLDVTNYEKLSIWLEICHLHLE